MVGFRPGRLKVTEHPEHIQELLAACRRYRGLDPRDVLEAIEDPQWYRAKATNDWRNQVPAEFMEMWDRLSPEARLSVYLFSANLASRQ